MSRAMATAFAVLLASTAAAQPAPSDEPTAIIHVIPSQCRTYASIPDDAHDSMLLWNQAMSLAACAQDTSVARVRDAESLAPMVDIFKMRLAPSLLIYMDILRNAPPTVQLRAAYQIGMAEVSLMIRARASLADDPALRAGLEPLLARVRYIAQLCFLTVDRAATTDPTLADDPVSEHMVRSARAMIRQLGRPRVEYQNLLAAP